MNKKMIGLILTVLFMVLSCSCSNNKQEKNALPEITTEIVKNDIETETKAKEEWDLIPRVMINGDLYIDTGKISSEARCGNCDGKITLSIDGTKKSSKNNSSNLGEEYEYQYWKDDEVHININNKWAIFKKHTREKKNLPVLEVNENCIDIKDGIDILKLRALIVTQLEDNGVRGDISSELKLKEITTKEVWENNKVQLFRVGLNYASLDGVAIIKDNKVLDILTGMPIESVFVADLDNDHIYEVYANVYFGFGMISEEILGYNVATNTVYKISKRGIDDLHLFIDKNSLKVQIKKTDAYETGDLTIISNKKFDTDVKGYNKVYNKTYGVEIYIKDGVNASQKTIDSILEKVRESDRANVGITAIEKPTSIKAVAYLVIENNDGKEELILRKIDND